MASIANTPATKEQVISSIKSTMSLLVSSCITKISTSAARAPFSAELAPFSAYGNVVPYDNQPNDNRKYIFINIKNVFDHLANGKCTHVFELYDAKYKSYVENCIKLYSLAYTTIDEMYDLARIPLITMDKNGDGVGCDELIDSCVDSVVEILSRYYYSIEEINDAFDSLDITEFNY